MYLTKSIEKRESRAGSVCIWKST